MNTIVPNATYFLITGKFQNTSYKESRRRVVFREPPQRDAGALPRELRGGESAPRGGRGGPAARHGALRLRARPAWRSTVPAWRHHHSPL